MEMMESYLISDTYSFGVPTGSERSETATEALGIGTVHMLPLQCELACESRLPLNRYN